MIRKFLFSLVMLLGISSLVSAQSLNSTGGAITFKSEKHKIDASSSTFTSTLDLSGKTIAFTVPIISFMLNNKAMTKHFNAEKVMNSEAFPNAAFTGTIVSDEDLTQPGTYEVKVEGEMTIKETTQNFTADGTIEVMEGGKAKAKSAFDVKREEYGLSEGRAKMVSEVISVSIDADYGQ